MVVTVATVNPRRTVSRCAVVIVMHAIFSPLPDIPLHVIEAELVWSERADRRRLAIVPFTAASVAVGHGSSVGLNVVAPRIYRLCSGAGRIFVFGFGQQPIGLAGYLGEPSRVLLRVPQIDIDDRLLPVSPALIVRLVST